MRGDDGRRYAAAIPPLKEWPEECDSITIYSGDGKVFLGTVSRRCAEAWENGAEQNILKYQPEPPQAAEPSSDLRGLFWFLLLLALAVISWKF